jgi:hypothetical protein
VENTAQSHSLALGAYAELDTVYVRMFQDCKGNCVIKFCDNLPVIAQKKMIRQQWQKVLLTYSITKHNARWIFFDFIECFSPLREHSA